MIGWFRRQRPAGSPGPAAAAPLTAERANRGVLVVDGNIADAALVVQIGDKSGAIVSTAYSIGKAVGLISRFRYKTILFDHEQIDGTGEDLVRLLRERGLIEATRFYAMTTGSPAVTAMKYVGQPVDDVLAKPLLPALLASVLKLPRKTE